MVTVVVVLAAAQWEMVLLLVPQGNSHIAIGRMRIASNASSIGAFNEQLVFVRVARKT